MQSFLIKALTRPLFAALPLVLMLTGCIVVEVPLGTTTTGSAPAVTAGPARLAAGCTRPGAAAAAQARVLQLLNAHRRNAGLAPLRASSRLATIAQGHACDNAARGSISHSGSDGADLSARMRRGGYALRTAAENTGLGFADAPDRMVAFWMASAGHRANILNPQMTEMGLGLTAGARPAWVLNLAQPR